MAHAGSSLGRIGYFTNVYPAPSHTTMRREIMALESLGWEVRRLAARPFSGRLVDPADAEEARRTVYTAASAVKAAWCLVFIALTQPLRLLRSLRDACWLGARSRSGAWKHLMYVAEAAVLVREARGCTHIHANFSNATSIAIMARVLGGPPVSIRVHGPEEFEFFTRADWTWRATHASYLIAISEFCERELRKRLNDDQHTKIQLVRCGVDDATLMRAAMALPAGPKLLCVARLEERKGHRVLLEAVHALRRRGVDLHLTLIGDGSLRESLETDVRRLGLTRDVRFAGWASGRDTLDAMQSARLVVLPSFAEGLPIVLMEAMALGRPVISTSVAGIPELVVDGITGWLVGPGDPQGLASAIEAALGARDGILARVTQEARRLVRTQHTTRETMQRLSGLILSDPEVVRP